MEPIETARLSLILLPHDAITALLGGVEARLPSGTVLPPDDFAGDRYVLDLRDRQLTADPSQAPWLLRLMVPRDGGGIAGMIGFHAPPEKGSVELGYRVRERYRGKGLATEAATAVLDWAARRGATRFVLSIAPHNTPSLAIARRLGFVHVGEQMDDVDGLELVYARDA